jgi:hypothetical protein
MAATLSRCIMLESTLSEPDEAADARCSDAAMLRGKQEDTIVLTQFDHQRGGGVVDHGGRQHDDGRSHAQPAGEGRARARRATTEPRCARQRALA